MQRFPALVPFAFGQGVAGAELHCQHWKEKYANDTLRCRTLDANEAVAHTAVVTAS